MPNISLKLVVPVLSILMHLIAFFQFKLQIDQSSFPSRWIGQFFFLLIISLTLSLLLFVFKKSTTRIILIFLRGITLILINFPLGQNLGVDLTLLVAFILDTAFYFSFIESIIFNSLTTIILLIIRGTDLNIWNQVVQAAPLNQLLFFATYSIILVIVSTYLKYQEVNQVSSDELNRRLNEATLKLAEANIQLQSYAALIEKEATLNERKRVAREMHDTVAYTLTNLVMMSDAAIGLAVTESNSLLDHLSRVRNKAQEGLADVRRTLQALRPVQLVEVHGLPAIKQLVSAFANATKIEVILNLGSAPLFFAEEIELVVYRLVQEGMTNALRHGKASQIFISLNLVDDNLIIQIKDNGVGSSGIKEGFGVTGMRERIQQLGGKLDVFTKPGEGFTLNAIIPLGRERE